MGVNNVFEASLTLTHLCLLDYYTFLFGQFIYNFRVVIFFGGVGGGGFILSFLGGGGGGGQGGGVFFFFFFFSSIHIENCGASGMGQHCLPVSLLRYARHKWGM